MQGQGQGQGQGQAGREQCVMPNTRRQYVVHREECVWVMDACQVILDTAMLRFGCVAFGKIKGKGCRREGNECEGYSLWFCSKVEKMAIEIVYI